MRIILKLPLMILPSAVFLYNSQYLYLRLQQQIKNSFNYSLNSSFCTQQKTSTSADLPFTPKHVLPHAILIGEKKCGTYALLRMLNDIYPNIRAFPSKEYHFFTTYYYQQQINSYIKSLPKMETPNDIIMERSPDYFRHPNASFRIFKDSPKSKFLVIVCDPARRVISDFVHEKFHGFLNKNKKLVPYLTFPNGTLRQDNYLLEPSLYGKHVKSWLKLFPLEQLLFISGQDFVSAPYKEFKRIEKFLNITPVVTSKTFSKDRNGFNCWRVAKGRKCIRKRKTKGRKHPTTVGEVKILISELKKYFTPLNNEFFNLIGMKFKWDMNKA